MLALLKRTKQSDRATIGELTFFEKDSPELVTLELPWKNNTPRVSCIPAGRYNCRRIVSKHFGPTFKIEDVPGRRGILFHVGNYPSDSMGCVLIGYSARHETIEHSVNAFICFLNYLKDVDQFTLIIEDVAK